MLARPKSKEHLWDIMFLPIQHPQVASQELVQELSDPLVQTWNHLSSHLEPYKHMGGSYKLLSTIWSWCNEISAKWTRLPHHYLTLIFRVSLISSLCS